jgi:DNA processing protein
MVDKEFYSYFLTWLWSITPIRLHELVEYFGSPQEVFEAGKKDLLFLPEKERNVILQVRELDAMYKFWEHRDRETCQFISSEDEEYPRRLLELADYPYGIYVDGELNKGRSVAMVGARNCTEYGRELAYTIARELGYHKISVISGLACGIDGAGHRGCMDGGGYTLGILGAGIHTIYPKENYDLYMQMKQHGGILSEYPPDLKPMPYLFPRRNRIISVLSDFVLVVEARRKSGSLITVDFALEQGKDIGAIPGRPCDRLSDGCNQLLQQGAKCILSAEDVLEEIMDMDAVNEMGRSKPATTNWDLVLAPKEKMVYSCLRLEPKFIDDILCQLNMPVWEGIQILTELEIKGIIKQNPHQYYYRYME